MFRKKRITLAVVRRWLESLVVQLMTLIVLLGKSVRDAQPSGQGSSTSPRRLCRLTLRQCCTTSQARCQSPRLKFPFGVPAVSTFLAYTGTCFGIAHDIPVQFLR